MTSFLLKVIDSEEERFFLWVPVCLGAGICWYFSLSQEPTMVLISFFLLLFCGLTGIALTVPVPWKRRFFWGLSLGLLGFCLSFFRTLSLDPGMLEQKIGPRLFQGTIVSVEQLIKDTRPSTRLTLTNLSLNTSFPLSLPRQVRIVLKKAAPTWTAGQRIQLRATLLPVAETPSPVCADLRRQAFFKGIGAVGFAVSDPKLLSSPEKPGWKEFQERTRQRLTQTLLEGLPSPLGSLAAALITGDTNALSPEVRGAFSNAGIAHVLAISGLHLSIVAGFIFWVVQGGLALVPPLALRYPLHKVAALLSLVMTFFYLGLSGAAVPARRAFLMTALVMIAILLDRRALTLRSVAIAATIILLLAPESLLGASFQLSFAAVIGLVTVYESLGKKCRLWICQDTFSGFSKIGLYGISSLLSSLVATAATTPFAIAFFHQLTLQSVTANLLVIPLVTFIVMPLAVIVCISYFCGCEGRILPIFSIPLEWLWQIAEKISSWPGALIQIPVGPTWALPLFSLSALWLCLWKSSLRWGGVIGIVFGFGGLFIPHVPDFWMDAEGKVLGFFEKKTKILWVSSLKKGTFAQMLWASAAGAREIKNFPETPDTLWGCDKSLTCWIRDPSKSCLFIRKDCPHTRMLAQFPLILSLKSFQKIPPIPGLLLDPLKTQKNGSYAIWMEDKIIVRHSRYGKEGRPWTKSSPKGSAITARNTRSFYLSKP